MKVIVTILFTLFIISIMKKVFGYLDNCKKELKPPASLNDYSDAEYQEQSKD